MKALDFNTPNSFGGSHWAREMVQLGRKPKLIAPRHLKAFLKRQKNDAADAEAFVEAAHRPTCASSKREAAVFSVHNVSLSENSWSITALSGQRIARTSMSSATSRRGSSLSEPTGGKQGLGKTSKMAIGYSRAAHHRWHGWGPMVSRKGARGLLARPHDGKKPHAVATALANKMARRERITGIRQWCLRTQKSASPLWMGTNAARRIASFRKSHSVRSSGSSAEMRSSLSTDGSGEAVPR
ncbi:hypothetical protein [Mesorhizobium sp.]|uniref:hypothetical protein n=1 Tax=Mesorhizobium sp. TaxID=1871066 RepID=UPI000FEA855C|nr:MAG: hypothetical protein EOR09_18145 [Mesorhizobium sp.]